MFEAKIRFSDNSWTKRQFRTMREFVEYLADKNDHSLTDEIVEINLEKLF